MRRFVLVVTQTAVGSGVLCAQVTLTSFPSGTYYQDFNTLATGGTGNAWTDDATLPGWYLSRTTYNAGTGSSNTGAAYSFGAAAASERALGSVASDATSDISYALRLLNDSANSYTQVQITYTGEQWRQAANVPAQVLRFGYQIGSNLVNPLGGTFTLVSGLDFQSPLTGVSGIALDGNAAPNRTTISLLLTLNESFDPGEELVLRWLDVNDAPSDHGLAIDDLSVAVPEASTWVVVPLTAFGLGLACWRAKRRRH